ncbi:MAG TPA: redoxin domain-containing protein, partial [Chthonomonadaceae bacterium]|nr:redoxin domain-containing protein [Chthonomonadaceae bacterium]
RAEQMRQALRLPFTILCDPERRVITEWGLLNPREHGGIAIPSVFVIGADLTIEFASVDRTAARVLPADILAFLAENRESPPAPRPVFPGLHHFAGALRNALRHGTRSPRGKR